MFRESSFPSWLVPRLTRFIFNTRVLFTTGPILLCVTKRNCRGSCRSLVVVIFNFALSLRRTKRTETNTDRLRAHPPGYLSEEVVLTYLKAIKCPSLLIRGEQGMVTDTSSFLARKATFGGLGGGTLRDLVLPGSHHLHVSLFSVGRACKRHLFLFAFCWMLPREVSIKGILPLSY